MFAGHGLQDVVSLPFGSIVFASHGLQDVVSHYLFESWKGVCRSWKVRCGLTTFFGSGMVLAGHGMQDVVS